MKLLDGKTAIVTGAARGIGKAIAQRFAGQGASIAITNIVEDEEFSNTIDEIKAHGVHIKGYVSNAASYVDSQIGLLINALKRYKLLDNTIIIIWGDHGYQLGEHAMWSSKHTNYETSALSLLVISVPGMKAKGQKTSSLTSFIDIYPSLAEICGFKIPSHCQGKSFKPLLDNPGISINQQAFSQYHKGGYKGYSIRDDRYRLVQWTKNNEVVYELYDHVADPDENKNIAVDPSMKSIVKSLSAQVNYRVKNDNKLKTLMMHQ
jgi:arylsulfatase A-like enzyme